MLTNKFVVGGIIVKLPPSWGSFATSLQTGRGTGSDQSKDLTLIIKVKKGSTWIGRLSLNKRKSYRVQFLLTPPHSQEDQFFLIKSPFNSVVE